MTRSPLQHVLWVRLVFVLLTEQMKEKASFLQGFSYQLGVKFLINSVASREGPLKEDVSPMVLTGGVL